ncbi:hypothetical protein GCM10010372_21100 [Streptomyces tauricus]|nr:hypothetical protein GCM10010372_21100 [Streptomyces tauricus]
MATAASTALPPLRRISTPAAEASASTLATAPPYPTATGTFSAGPEPPAAAPEEGGAAPTDTTAADTASTASLRATERPISTSSQRFSAQRNFLGMAASGTSRTRMRSPANMRAHE